MPDAPRLITDLSDHARANAASWLDTIREHFEVIDDEADVLDADGDALTSADERVQAERERMQEEPLSIQVRGDWCDPGASPGAPTEFVILLSTGGPALRICGDLDRWCEPTRAYLQYQDWGTPWTDFFGEPGDDLGLVLRYAREFYFGEGA